MMLFELWGEAGTIAAVCTALFAWRIVVPVDAGVGAVFLCSLASQEKHHRGFNKAGNEARINNACRALYVYL